MKVSIEADELVIRIKMEPKPYKATTSGRSLVVASSRGNVPVDLTVDGRQLQVALTVFAPLV